ncbi:MAG: UvrD-helicase domain-containing protein [Planctomycetes bacterium]|nr:UvrD-helicase domain-containing protein [Planctomycetota bacterium]
MKAPAETDRLNDFQRAALDLDRDLLVSAGAGAGKTQVLGLRILAALETGRARVSEILAFTFTDKAAAEMRQRVQQLLLARLEELRGQGDCPALRNLHRARAEFSQNRISTVHSFCHRLLSEYAWEAGLEPHPPILDPRAQRAARESALRRVLLQTPADDPLNASLEGISASARLYALTQFLHMAVQNRHTIGPALQAAARVWQNPQPELQRRRAAWLQWQQQQLAPVLELAGTLSLAGARRIDPSDKLAAIMLALARALKAPTLRGLSDLLLTRSGEARKFTRDGAKKNWPGPELEQARQDLAALAQTLQPPMELLGRYDFDEVNELRCGQTCTDLHALLSRLIAAYTEECAGGLDFLELELRAIALLQDHADLAAEVAQRTRLMFVDEYQDTNPTQGQLFSLLMQADQTPGRFFAVGDSKQSIYGFRGSDVSIFHYAREVIAQRNAGLKASPQRLPWGLQTPDAPDHRRGLINMAVNYRSVAPLVQAGNVIFRRLLQRTPMRPFDARPQDMVVGRTDLKAAPDALEMHLIRSHDRGDTENPAAMRAPEAQFVATRVQQMLAAGAGMGDIAILVRRGTRNEDYRSAFSAAGIPLVVVADRGLLQTQEAQDCINLLRLCANPGDDIAALGVLRSAFGGLNDRELTALALATPKGTLIDRLRAWPDLDACAAATGFLAMLDSLLRLAGRELPTMLLSRAIDERGLALAIGVASDAEQRLANLGRMLDVVREMQHQYPTLASLARELAVRADEGDEEAQGVPQDAGSGVRLMTVHASKGLEFPIVILPDLGARPNGGDVGLVRSIAINGAPQGLWLKGTSDTSRGTFLPDFAAWQESLAVQERADAETRRVLYVAWTRAQKQLVLVGTVGQEIRGESWAARMLNAMGVTEFGQAATQAPPELSLHWHQGAERTLPKSRKQQIAALESALRKGRLELARPIDTSLVAPLPRPAAAAFVAEPEAAEFGTLVHAGIERCLRLGATEAGIADARLRASVGSALEALATLAPARHSLPEFTLVTPQGSRRVDLLRALDNHAYEIVDFKTDGEAYDVQQRHGPQLRGYGQALRDYLQARRQPVNSIRLLVCLASQTGLPPAQRLVEIEP